MNKKKICFIAQFPPPMHGLSKAVETLYNSDLLKELDLEKVNITNNNKFLKNLKIIAGSKADLFYFTISQTKGGNLRDLVIIKLLQLRHKKCLIHLHGGYYRTLVDKDMSFLQRKINYNTISKVDGAIVLGPSLRWIFEGMIPDEKIYTIANCVDDRYLMSDEEFHSKTDSLENSPVKHVLYLSNFIRSKGYREVLEMARLEKERVDAGGKQVFLFDFAGKFFDKVEEKYFNDYIKANRLEDYITYHGVVDGDRKQDLLIQCNFFVLLTRYPNEGQPISILEAMGNGTVIVTTNHAGIPDIVKNGINGIVISADKCNVADCYKSMLDISDERMKEIITENRNIVFTSFREKTYTENMKKIFMRI